MFLLLIKIYKIIFKLIFKLTIKVLFTDILDSKLISKRLIQTNLEYKVISNLKTWQLMVKYQFKNYFINLY